MQVQKTATELKIDFEVAQVMLPTQELRDLAKSMMNRGGLPDFQFVLNPDLEPLRDILNELLTAEQRERAPQKKRA